MAEVKLAGRCSCGILERLATGDEHLACRGERRCRACEAVKALAAFPTHRGEAHPRHVCTACANARMAERRAQRRDVDRGYHRERARLRSLILSRTRPPSYVRRIDARRLRDIIAESGNCHCEWPMGDDMCARCMGDIPDPERARERGKP